MSFTNPTKLAFHNLSHEQWSVLSDPQLHPLSSEELRKILDSLFSKMDFSLLSSQTINKLLHSRNFSQLSRDQLLMIQTDLSEELNRVPVKEL